MSLQFAHAIPSPAIIAKIVFGLLLSQGAKDLVVKLISSLVRVVVVA